MPQKLSHVPHVRGRLDAWNELQRHISETDDADHGAGDDLQHVAGQQDAADEDVEDAPAEEGEHEAGISADVGRDLELCTVRTICLVSQLGRDDSVGGELRTEKRSSCERRLSARLIAFQLPRAAIAYQDRILSRSSRR